MAEVSEANHHTHTKPKCANPHQRPRQASVVTFKGHTRVSERIFFLKHTKNMPLDIDDFRTYKGGNPDLIRESERRRFNDVSKVEEIIQLDEHGGKMRGDVDNMRKEKGKLANKSLRARRTKSLSMIFLPQARKHRKRSPKQKRK